MLFIALFMHITTTSLANPQPIHHCHCHCPWQQRASSHWKQCQKPKSYWSYWRHSEKLLMLQLFCKKKKKKEKEKEKEKTQNIMWKLPILFWVVSIFCTNPQKLYMGLANSHPILENPRSPTGFCSIPLPNEFHQNSLPRFWVSQIQT